MIREGWLDSERIDILDAQAERFFLRLCLKADDFGRFHAAPQLLKSLLFPMKDGIRATDMSRCLAECEKSGLLRCYESAGRRFLEIERFDQRMRSKVSKFPEPETYLPSHDGHMTGICQADDGHMTVACPPEVEEKRSISEVITGGVEADRAGSSSVKSPVEETEQPEPKTPTLVPIEEDEQPPLEQPSKEPIIPDDDRYVELQDLIGKVQTKHPRLPIITWYGNNRKKHPEAIKHVLRSLLKGDDNVTYPYAYLQKALDVEDGKYNAAEFDKEQERIKRDKEVNPAGLARVRGLLVGAVAGVGR